MRQVGDRSTEMQVEAEDSMSAGGVSGARTVQDCKDGFCLEISAQ